MFKFFKKFFKDEQSSELDFLSKRVLEINKWQDQYEKIADSEFPKLTADLKARVQKGESLDNILPEAFSLVREASKRTLGMKHFDVQLIGGMVIHRGKIAEMRTGEGKTLVATLPAYLNALTGRGVHIITVNDFLAKRDADWMGQIYSFLGMSVGVIVGQQQSFVYQQKDKELQEDSKTDTERDEKGGFKIFDEYLKPCSRKEAYDCDITYGTNNEFGFDYLRDNTAYSTSGVVQRGHYFAIVDEIDSILIDEARVPLILSRAAEKADDLYKTFAKIAFQLEKDVDYKVDEKYRAIQLTDSGIEKAEKILGIQDIYTEKGIVFVHHLENAVKAKAIFTRDKDYVVRNNEVIIIDAFTGRLQEGRRFSDGIHQAIEAKEGVEIKEESRTAASITYQNYFRFYSKLAGMTGTAKTSSEEFYKVYGLDVIEIPTNKPSQRVDLLDSIFRTEKGKFKAIAKIVKELHEKGQPVLIGTASVEKNELLSAFLKQEGIPHNILNAKNHEQEGLITAKAGEVGAVTLATNMAGRGVDIKLGGVNVLNNKIEEVKKMGGLFVLGTERLESRRIDNQLRGRAGRQGDPGVTQFFISLEDTLARVFGGDRMKNLIDQFDGGKTWAEDEPIILGQGLGKIFSQQIEKAQERYEGMNFDHRKNTLAYDEVLSSQRNSIYARRKRYLFADNQELDLIWSELLEKLEKKEDFFEKLQDKKKELNEEFYLVFKRVLLSVIDQLWMQHLEIMEATRQSVALRAYGQREPLVEYKKEALKTFQSLESEFINRVFDLFFRFQKIAPPNINFNTIETKTDLDKVGRNEKILITKNGEDKMVKAKKVDEYLADGWSLKR